MQQLSFQDRVKNIQKIISALKTKEWQDPNVEFGNSNAVIFNPVVKSKEYEEFGNSNAGNSAAKTWHDPEFVPAEKPMPKAIPSVKKAKPKAKPKSKPKAKPKPQPVAAVPENPERSVWEEIW
jgi:outer membrane biosynthesis protein TonB